MSARVTGAGGGAVAVAGGRCQAGEVAVGTAGDAVCQAAELDTPPAPNTRKTATCAKRLQKFDRIIPQRLPWPSVPAAIEKITRREWWRQWPGYARYANVPHSVGCSPDGRFSSIRQYCARFRSAQPEEFTAPPESTIAPRANSSHDRIHTRMILLMVLVILILVAPRIAISGSAGYHNPSGSPAATSSALHHSFFRPVEKPSPRCLLNRNQSLRAFPARSATDEAQPGLRS